jgi:hypothetical protein
LFTKVEVVWLVTGNEVIGSRVHRPPAAAANHAVGRSGRPGYAAGPITPSGTEALRLPPGSRRL